MLFNILVIIVVLLVCYGERTSRLGTLNVKDDTFQNGVQYNLSEDSLKLVKSLVEKWAPLIWLAPDEEFLPSSVPDFLTEVTPTNRLGQKVKYLPLGRLSQEYYLSTRESIGTILQNKSSFLYGKNPKHFQIPAYAQVTLCDSSGKYFSVNYWFFFPYNKGKSICSVGFVPMPEVRSMCLGHLHEYSNHIGDWEHMSLFFQGDDEPTGMYVSVHDAGAYYSYNKKKQKFLFLRQELRKGIMQKPSFPQQVYLSKTYNRLEFFAAKGSHGLWAEPGKHKFYRLPRLYDESGYGIPWMTWKTVELLISGYSAPIWLDYWGRWGNHRNNCHPLEKIGIELCQTVDGPVGLPLKENHFKCNASLRQQRGSEDVTKEKRSFSVIFKMLKLLKSNTYKALSTSIFFH